VNQQNQNNSSLIYLTSNLLVLSIPFTIIISQVQPSKCVVENRDFDQNALIRKSYSMQKGKIIEKHWRDKD